MMKQDANDCKPESIDFELHQFSSFEVRDSRIRDQSSKTLKQQKSSKKTSESNYYRWTQKEEKKYLLFLQKYGSLFNLGLAQRKKVKIHCRLSTFIKSRDPIQCRSHHQKMLKKYGSIQTIIDQFPIELFQEKKIINKVQMTLKTPQTKLIDYSQRNQSKEPSFWQEMVGECPSLLCDILIL